MLDHEPVDQGPLSQPQRGERMETIATESLPDRVLRLPRVKPRDHASKAVLSALCGAVSRIASSDLEARQGEPEGIHRLRTSTRRLRSELRAFRGLVDPRWREPLERELQWLGSLLGGARDVDVLLARLRKAASTLHENDAKALSPLFGSLQARHAAAAVDLQTGLRSVRYHALIDTLKQSIERPVLLNAARENCRDVLPPLAIAAWRKLKRKARALRPSDPDEEFHEVRKRAKRARYTAELIAPVLHRRSSRSANRFIRLTTQVQTLLGEHQDATLAGQAIESQLAEHTDDPGFAEVAGRLLDTQKNAARTARAEFFNVWEKLDRKTSRRWMKIESKTHAKAK
jgi:CHAD domain-containing protein